MHDKIWYINLGYMYPVVMSKLNSAFAHSCSLLSAVCQRHPLSVIEAACLWALVVAHL